MNTYNRDLIDPTIEPNVFEKASEAIEYALSEYWVHPVHLTTEEQAFGFNMAVKATDFAQSGKVHFRRR